MARLILMVRLSGEPAASNLKDGEMILVARHTNGFDDLLYIIYKLSMFCRFERHLYSFFLITFAFKKHPHSFQAQITFLFQIVDIFKMVKSTLLLAALAGIASAIVYDDSVYQPVDCTSTL